VILHKKGGLKVKIRNLVVVVAMLSTLIFGIGTANAIFGVNDKVPGQDIVIPIICEGEPGAGPNDAPVFGSLDTLWAIAQTSPSVGLNTSKTVPPPDASTSHDTGPVGTHDCKTYASYFGYSRRSVQTQDLTTCWTDGEIISDSCSRLITTMDHDAQVKMAYPTTISGKKVFVGYVKYQKVGDTVDNLVSWVYITDLQKGYASGFDGISMEKGTTAELREDGASAPVTAVDVFPRVFLKNKLSESFNWWLILLGRNAYCIDNPQICANPLSRYLDCVFCDEFENCQSNTIQIPDEFNVIDIVSKYPNVLKPSGTPATPDSLGKTCTFGDPGCPVSGFATCTVTEKGVLSDSSPITIIGTADSSIIPGQVSLTNYYSLFGWSLQRAEDDGGLSKLSWDVTHEMHRTYCSGSRDGVNFDNPADNSAGCTVTTP